MRNRCKVLKEVYKVDEDKKTIVCILTFDMQLNKAATCLVYPAAFIADKDNETYGKAGIYTVIGISKCHPEDNFDVVKGKRIAQSKAKLEMKPHSSHDCYMHPRCCTAHQVCTSCTFSLTLSKLPLLFIEIFLLMLQILGKDDIIVWPLQKRRNYILKI